MRIMDDRGETIRIAPADRLSPGANSESIRRETASLAAADIANNQFDGTVYKPFFVVSPFVKGISPAAQKAANHLCKQLKRRSPEGFNGAKAMSSRNIDLSGGSHGLFSASLPPHQLFFDQPASLLFNDGLCNDYTYNWATESGFRGITVVTTGPRWISAHLDDYTNGVLRNWQWGGMFMALGNQMNIAVTGGLLEKTILPYNLGLRWGANIKVGARGKNVDQEETSNRPRDLKQLQALRTHAPALRCRGIKPLHAVLHRPEGKSITRWRQDTSGVSAFGGNCFNSITAVDWVKSFVRYDLTRSAEYTYKSWYNPATARSIRYDSPHALVRWWNNMWRSARIPFTNYRVKAELVPIPTEDNIDGMQVGDEITKTWSVDKLLYGALGSLFVFVGRQWNRTHQASLTVKKQIDDSGAHILSVRCLPQQQTTKRSFAVVTGGLTADIAAHNLEHDTLEVEFRIQTSQGENDLYGRCVYRHFIAGIGSARTLSDMQAALRAAERKAAVEVAAAKIYEGSVVVTRLADVVDTQSSNEQSVRWNFIPDFIARRLPRGTAAGVGTYNSKSRVSASQTLPREGIKQESQIEVDGTRNLRGHLGNFEKIFQTSLIRSGPVGADFSKYAEPVVDLTLRYHCARVNERDMNRLIFDPMNRLFGTSFSAPRSGSGYASRDAETVLQLRERDFCVLASGLLGNRCTDVLRHKAFANLGSLNPPDVSGVLTSAQTKVWLDFCAISLEKHPDSELVKDLPGRSEFSEVTLGNLCTALHLLGKKAFRENESAAEKTQRDEVIAQLESMIPERVSFAIAWGEAVLAYARSTGPEGMNALHETVRGLAPKEAGVAMAFATSSDAYERPQELVHKARLQYGYDKLRPTDSLAHRKQMFSIVGEIQREIESSEKMLLSDMPNMPQPFFLELFHKMQASRVEALEMISVDHWTPQEIRHFRIELEGAYFMSERDYDIVRFLELREARLSGHDSNRKPCVPLDNVARPEKSFKLNTDELKQELQARRQWLRNRSLFLDEATRKQEMTAVDARLDELSDGVNGQVPQGTHVDALTREELYSQFRAASRSWLASLGLENRELLRTLRQRIEALDSGPMSNYERLCAQFRRDEQDKIDRLRAERLLDWESYIREPVKLLDDSTQVLHKRLRKLREIEKASWDELQLVANERCLYTPRRVSMVAAALPDGAESEAAFLRHGETVLAAVRRETRGALEHALKATPLGLDRLGIWETLLRTLPPELETAAEFTLPAANSYEVTQRLECVHEHIHTIFDADAVMHESIIRSHGRKLRVEHHPANAKPLTLLRQSANDKQLLSDVTAEALFLCSMLTQIGKINQELIRRAEVQRRSARVVAMASG